MRARFFEVDVSVLFIPNPRHTKDPNAIQLTVNSKAFFSIYLSTIHPAWPTLGLVFSDMGGSTVPPSQVPKPDFNPGILEQIAYRRYTAAEWRVSDVLPASVDFGHVAYWIRDSGRSGLLSEDFYQTTLPLLDAVLSHFLEPVAFGAWVDIGGGCRLRTRGVGSGTCVGAIGFSSSNRSSK